MLGGGGHAGAQVVALQALHKCAAHNAYLRSGAATQLKMLHRFTDLCAETCRQREENETHSTQAIIKRINRYIEDNVEN